MEEKLKGLVGSRVRISCLYHSISFSMEGKLIARTSWYHVIDDRLNFVSFNIEDVLNIEEEFYHIEIRRK